MKIIRKIPTMLVPNGFWYEQEGEKWPPELVEQWGGRDRWPLTLADGYDENGDPLMAQWIGEDGDVDSYGIWLKGDYPDEEELNEMRVLEIKFMMGEQ